MATDRDRPQSTPPDAAPAGRGLIALPGLKGTPDEPKLSKRELLKRKWAAEKVENHLADPFKKRDKWDGNRPPHGVMRWACLRNPGFMLATDAYPMVHRYRPALGRSYDHLRSLLETGYFTVVLLGEFLLRDDPDSDPDGVALYAPRLRGAKDKGILHENENPLPDPATLMGGRCLFFDLAAGECHCPAHLIPSECQHYRTLGRWDPYVLSHLSRSWLPHGLTLLKAATEAARARKVVPLGFGRTDLRNALVPTQPAPSDG